MKAFDAETYLRLVGERALLDRQPGGREQAHALISEAANALFASGAITAATAQAAVDEYALALALREPGWDGPDILIRQPVPPADVPPRKVGRPRVARSDQVITLPRGRLHLRYIRLADDATTLYVTVDDGSRPGSPRTSGQGAGPWWGDEGPLELTVADDRGTTAVAGFSGGGAGAAWLGQFRVSPALSPQTKWISVLGERIEIADGPPAAGASVQSRATEDPARRYLWQRVAQLARQPGAPALAGMAIETLRAAGALSAGDPVGQEARDVLDALSRPGAGSPVATRIAGPWGSLLARRRVADGPVGAVVMGTVTPPFDGIVAVVTSLASWRSGFSIDVEVVPNPATGRLPGDRVGQPRLSWWAEDSLGQPYLGSITSWNARDGGGDGQVEFWPALDPRAATLTLTPAALTSRAVIPVPLTSMVGP